MALKYLDLQYLSFPLSLPRSCKHWGRGGEGLGFRIKGALGEGLGEGPTVWRKKLNKWLWMRKWFCFFVSGPEQGGLEGQSQRRR